jgi:hypothetical protein
MDTQHFSQAFLFSNKKMKTEILFFLCLTGRPTRSTGPLPKMALAASTGKRLARLGGAAHERGDPKEKQRGERGTGTTPVPATSRRCGVHQRPTANSGQARTSERAHKIHEKMANTGEQREVERG